MTATNHDRQTATATGQTDRASDRDSEQEATPRDRLARRTRRTGTDGGLPGTGPDLSVVVVTRDEEDRVRPCLESVFDSCRGIGSFEVILVDSASTDRTVEYATEYPITVLQIAEEHTVSASTGRYVGENFARGDLLLHVDGDMELTGRWLARAVAYIQSHDVAAVDGELDETDGAALSDDSEEPTREVEEVETINGVMLFDAETLADVGGFDPHLHGYEDIDVSLRLRAAGHTLVRLPTISAHHPDRETFLEAIRRWRHGYFFAPGQAIRKSLRQPRIAATLVARQQYKFALLGWLVLGGASLYGTTTFLGWLLASMLGFGMIVARRGLRGGVSFVVAKLFGLAGMTVGLRTAPRPPEAYPLDAVEVVEQGIVHEGTVEDGEWDIA